METFSDLLALCEVKPPVTDEFPAQRPVMRSFDIFFDLHLIKQLSKQARCLWFETPSAHYDVIVMSFTQTGLIDARLRTVYLA